ncbi:MAG TPA: hypothetical protein VK087_03965 [Tissierellaceae bacterium]|nr:hypothetical protein [Tissierellaceae bacterium]
MNLINEKVIHDTFGEGSIVDQSKDYLEVNFKSGSKRFVFPDVFANYMSLVDGEIANLVNKEVDKMKKERKKEALQLEREQKIEEERRDILRRERSIKNKKIHLASQSVFWCQQDEIEDIFTKWAVSVGTIKSGKRKGQPRRLARIDRNSACLLTVRPDDNSEKNRRIIGAFMSDIGSDDDLFKDGYIPAHSQHRIHLSEEESEKILFWNYYLNKRDPDRIVWKSGRQRYFDNIWMAQILRDILELRKDSEEEKDVQLFFEYFCQINSINMDEIPEANGPLSK